MQKKIFLLSAVFTAIAAELVTNGGFETGTVSPWVIGGGGSAHVASNSDSTTFLPVAAHSGTHFLYVLSFLFRDSSTISREKADEPASELSNNGLSAPTTISQEVTVVAGTTYHFSASYAAFDQPFDGCFASAAVGITSVASATLFASQSGNGITVPPYFTLSGTYVAPAGSTGQQSLVDEDLRHLIGHVRRTSVQVCEIKIKRRKPRRKRAHAPEIVQAAKDESQFLLVHTHPLLDSDTLLMCLSFSQAAKDESQFYGSFGMTTVTRQFGTSCSCNAIVHILCRFPLINLMDLGHWTPFLPLDLFPGTSQPDYSSFWPPDTNGLSFIPDYTNQNNSRKF
ncbi:hypothetical protein B0H13DRAFT_1913423 [Mycena leptocephala]|nr:hypothetical protein B0H13DRAFT_1913423 [Mycena leptocephala]